MRSDSPWERRASAMTMNQTSDSDSVTFHFPLLEGGPTYRFLLSMGLLKPDGRLPITCALVSILVSWVPLLILSWLQGVAFGDKVQVPLLLDFPAYTRLLIAVPLMIISEAVIGPQLAVGAGHFFHAGLVREKDHPAFQAAVNRALALRDSALAEAVVVVLAYVGAFSSVMVLPGNASMWHTASATAGLTLSWAGWWFGVFLFRYFSSLSTAGFGGFSSGMAFSGACPSST